MLRQREQEGTLWVRRLIPVPEREGRTLFRGHPSGTRTWFSPNTSVFPSLLCSNSVPYSSEIQGLGWSAVRVPHFSRLEPSKHKH